MVELKLLHKSPDEVMTSVRALRVKGIVQGKDFDFSYHHAQYDDTGHDAVSPRQAIFIFYTEKYATLFALKYM